MATEQKTSGAVQVSSSAAQPLTAAQQRATEHKGTADTEVLVRDIEKTREELASTIDQIVDRVSPKKVVERTKQQATEAAKQGVHDATVLVKGAAEVVREKATTAGELLKEKTGTATEAVKDRVGGGDSTPPRSPLTPATSVAVGSASPVTSSSDAGATASYQSVPSPLPAGTQSVDVGRVPPPEPADTTGSLADAAERAEPAVEPAGADVPSHPPVRTYTMEAPSSGPVLAGAGLAAALALLVLLLRRRSR